MFQVIQKNLAFIGYDRTQRPFNKRQIEIGVKMVLCICLYCIHLVRVAKTPREYMESIFETSATVSIFISFISTVSNMDIIFTLIEKGEALMAESKIIF